MTPVEQAVEVFARAMYEDIRAEQGTDEHPPWEECSPVNRHRSKEQFLVPIQALADAGLLKEQA